MANSKKITIETKFGQQALDLEKIIYFPQGLMGFENKHSYTLIQVEPESPFLILQCIDDPTLGLLVADPYSFIKTYNIKLNDIEEQILCLTNPKQLAVLVTVSIPPGKPENSTLNLTGPIVINAETKVGLQVPQTDSNTPHQLYLYPQNTIKNSQKS